MSYQWRVDRVMPQFQESILIPLRGCVKIFLTGDAKETGTTSLQRRNVSKHVEVFLNTKCCMNSVQWAIVNSRFLIYNFFFFWSTYAYLFLKDAKNLTIAAIRMLMWNNAVEIYFAKETEMARDIASTLVCTYDFW